MAFVGGAPVPAVRTPLRLAVDRPWTGAPVRGRSAAAAGRRPAWCHRGGAQLLPRRGRRVGPTVEPPRCQHTSESEPPDYSAGWVPEKVRLGFVDVVSGGTGVGWEVAHSGYPCWMAVF